VQVRTDPVIASPPLETPQQAYDIMPIRQFSVLLAFRGVIQHRYLQNPIISRSDREISVTKLTIPLIRRGIIHRMNVTALPHCLRFHGATCSPKGLPLSETYKTNCRDSVFVVCSLATSTVRISFGLFLTSKETDTEIARD
jgi:hypothetical protein